MKLLYVFPELKQCGPVNQSYYLLKGLVENSVEVTLYTFYRKNPDQSQVERFESAGVSVQAFKLSVRGIFHARNHLRVVRPDCVHSTLLVADLVSYLISAGCKRFLTHRTDPYDHVGSRGWITGLLMFYCSKFLSKRAHKVVACSNAIHQRLVGNGVKSDFVIQNCVSKGFYSAFFDRPAFCLSDFEESKMHLRVISIGALSERKNPLKTFFILDQLSKRYGIRVELTFLGDGELMNTLSALSPNVNMTVNLLGQVLDVRPFIRSAHIHFSASIAEGLPNSVLETLSCGLTNVLSDIPEHREFVVSAEKLIFLFSLDDDVDAICLNLIKYIECAEKKSELDLNNFRSDFSEEKLVSSYLKVYAD